MANEYIVPVGIETNELLKGFDDLDRGLDNLENKAAETSNALNKSMSRSANSAKNLDDNLVRIAPSLDAIRGKANQIEFAMNGVRTATNKAVDDKPLSSFKLKLEAIKKVFSSIKSDPKEFFAGMKQGFKESLVASESYQKGLKGVAKETDNTASKSTNLKTIIAGVFGGAVLTRLFDSLVSLGKEVVSTTAEFQKFEAVLTNTLGSNSKAKQAMSDIVAFAAKTPFAVNELTNSFVKFANRGVILTQKEMTKLGDIAASQGKSFDQLTEAALDAQTGEFERLKEFGIKGSKAGDQVTLSFKGLIKTVKNSPTEIQNAIYEFGELEGVAGGMEAISKTVGGQISNIGDNFTSLLKEIGDGSTDIIVGILSFVNDTISALRAIPKWFKESKDAIIAFAFTFALLNAMNIARVVAGWVLQMVGYAASTRGAAAAELLLAGAKRVGAVAAKALVALMAFAIVKLYQERKEYDELVKSISATNTIKRVGTEISKRATDAIGNEIAKVELLRKQLKNKNLTREDQIALLNQLKALAPQILKGLTLENLETSKGIALLKEYTKQLYAKAEAQALSEIYEEKIKKRLELANQYDVSLSGLDATDDVVAQSKAYEQLDKVLDKFDKNKEGFGTFVLNRITGSKSERDKAYTDILELKKLTGDIAVIGNKIASSDVKTPSTLTPDVPTPTGDTKTPTAKSGGSDRTGIEKEKSDQIIKFVRALRDAEIAALEDDYERQRQTVEANYADNKEDLAKELSLTKEGAENKRKLILQLGANTKAAIIEINENEKAAKLALQIEANRELTSLQEDSTQKSIDLINQDADAQIAAIKKKYEKQIEIQNSLIDAVNKERAKKEKEVGFDAKVKQLDEENKLTIAILEAYGIKNIDAQARVYSKEVELAGGNKKDLVAIQKSKHLVMLTAEILHAEKMAKVASERYGGDSNEAKVAQAEVDKLKAEFKTELDQTDKIDLSGIFELNTNDIGKSLGQVLNFKGKGGDSLGKQLGLNKSEQDALVSSFGDAFEQIGELYAELVQSQIDKKDEQIDALSDSIDDAESEYERELALQEQGYANNAAAKKKEIEELKLQREKEQKDKEKLLKKKQALAKIEIAVATAVTLANLISGAAQAIAAHASIPFVGVAFGLAAAAAIVAGYLGIKAQSNAATADAQFAEGGEIDGKSHSQGGEKYRSIGGNKVIELEGGEYVTKKSSTKKHYNLIEAINNDDFRGVDANDESLRQMLAQSGIMLHSDLPKEAVKRSNELGGYRAAIIYGNQNSTSDKNLEKIAQNTEVLAEAEKNKEIVTYDNGYKIVKKGNLTRKIKINE